MGLRRHRPVARGSPCWARNPALSSMDMCQCPAAHKALLIFMSEDQLLLLKNKLNRALIMALATAE